MGGYDSLESFSDGMNTAVLVGAGVVALGAIAAFAMPARLRPADVHADAAPALEEAA
jgi:hypothetical protein